MKLRLSVILPVVLLAALLLTACTSPAPAPAAAPKEAPAQPAHVAATQPPAAAKVFKVGVLAPLTGPNARVGEEFKNSVTMAFDAISWQVGPYKIEPVWIDEETDPEKASRAYEAAVERDKIDAGILNWDASCAVAVMEVAAKHKVPHFLAMGSTELVNEKYKSDPKYTYWIGKGWPSASLLTVSYVRTLDDAITKGLWKPAKRTVALFGTDDDWARSFDGAIGGQLKEAGWQIVAEEYAAIGETDFYPMLTKLKGLDVALLAGTMSDAAAYTAFIKQAREVGLKSLIVADGLGWVGEWYSLTGKASDGVIDQIPGWTSAKAVKFRDDFLARWKIEPSPSSAGLAYDETGFFIKVLQETYKKYGELTRDTVYKVGHEDVATGKLTYTDGILMQEYKFTAETMPDPVVGKGAFVFPVIQYKGGEGKVIWPDESKQVDLVAP